jgi:predicted nucleic acid-binding protein
VTAVIDASLAVEYLLRTELGDKAAPLIERETLVAPELLDAEVFATIRLAVLRQELGLERAEQALTDLEIWDVERIAHQRLWRSAWQFRNNVSGYDAFYVAAAALFDAPLLTADGPLARAPRLGIVIQNLRL